MRLPFVFFLLFNLAILFPANGQISEKDCSSDTVSFERFKSLSVFLEIPLIKSNLNQLDINNGIVYLTNSTESGYLFGVVLYLNVQLYLVSVSKVRFNVSKNTFESKMEKPGKIKKYKKIFLDNENLESYYAFFKKSYHKDLEVIFSLEHGNMKGGFVSNSFILLNPKRNSYCYLMSKIIEISKNKW